MAQLRSLQVFHHKQQIAYPIRLSLILFGFFRGLREIRGEFFTLLRNHGVHGFTWIFSSSPTSANAESSLRFDPPLSPSSSTYTAMLLLIGG
jgi:hypothetical protein